MPYLLVIDKFSGKTVGRVWSEPGRALCVAGDTVHYYHEHLGLNGTGTLLDAEEDPPVVSCMPFPAAVATEGRGPG